MENSKEITKKRLLRYYQSKKWTRQNDNSVDSESDDPRYQEIMTRGGGMRDINPDNVDNKKRQYRAKLNEEEIEKSIRYAKGRNPAQSDEELKANIEAAEGDFEESDSAKKTISVREIDPEAEKRMRMNILRQKAIKAKKEYDKKKYEELMRERAIKGQ